MSSLARISTTRTVSRSTTPRCSACPNGKRSTQYSYDDRFRIEGSVTATTNSTSSAAVSEPAGPGSPNDSFDAADFHTGQTRTPALEQATLDVMNARGISPTKIDPQSRTADQFPCHKMSDPLTDHVVVMYDTSEARCSSSSSTPTARATTPSKSLPSKPASAPSAPTAVPPPRRSRATTRPSTRPARQR